MHTLAFWTFAFQCVISQKNQAVFVVNFEGQFQTSLQAEYVFPSIFFIEFVKLTVDAIL